LSIRIESIGVEGDEMWKILDKILHQAHMIPGIVLLKSDPVSGEYVFIWEVYTQEEGYTEDDG
jgi:hypothetical protein